MNKNLLRASDRPIFFGSELKSALYHVLEQNSTLKELALENLRLGDTELAGVSEGLTQNNTLEKLSIPGTLLNWTQLKEFLSFTPLNESLQWLGLSGSKFNSNVGATPEADIKGVFEAIERSKLTNVEVEPWFWDPTKFSDSVGVHVVSAKNKLKDNLR
jgi:hypothetical protein